MGVENKIYPKILIIGQSFNKKSGGGITISNLFYGWPKDRIAVASNLNLSSELDTTICEEYYQLGYNGKLHPFPLNILLSKIKCGRLILEKDGKADKVQTGSRIVGKYNKIYTVLTASMKFLGIYNFFYRLKITQDFTDWLNDFNPDIIYSQLSTLELVRFVSDLQKQFMKPIAIHIMDDWPTSLNKASLFYNYQKKTLDKEFRDLLERSSILMSICQAMSDEYQLRYNRSFIPFHNPIEINRWLPSTRLDWHVKDVFRILYTGRIGAANGKSIMFFARIIHEMNAEGKRIELDVFTSDINTRKAKSIDGLRGVKIKKYISHDKMPSLLSSYDLLFLPLDFDKTGIRYAQFSMPTKASEYMISGTPVLVYADKRTALAKYASSHKWAFAVNENDRAKLTEAINILINDLSLRKELAERAREIVIKNEDAEIIREKFRKNFILT